jgi:hypothetical protein
MEKLTNKQWQDIRHRLSAELGVHPYIAEDIVNFLQDQPEFSAPWIDETAFKDQRNLERDINETNNKIT